jgi:hypothetical protein
MSVPLVELLNKLQKGAETENTAVKVINSTTGTKYDLTNTAALPTVLIDTDGTILIQTTI